MSTERTIIVAADARIAIRSRADVTDAVGACFGADGLLLQKFVNYRS